MKFKTNKYLKNRKALQFFTGTHDRVRDNEQNHLWTIHNDSALCILRLARVIINIIEKERLMKPTSRG